jgi:hypothetical protein
MTLTALEATMMTTTEFTHDLNCASRTPWLPQNAERKAVRMNWVVVTDESRKHQLRMHWRADHTS